MAAAIVLTGCGYERPPAHAPYLPEVYVEVRADREGAVLERSHDDGPWDPVCVAPCRRTVRPDAVYRIAGEGIRPSDPFVLYQPATVAARTGTPGTRAAGIVGVSIGIPLFVIGMFAMVPALRYDGDGWILPATVMAIGGLSTIGGAAAIANSRTEVDVRERAFVPKIALRF